MVAGAAGRSAATKCAANMAAGAVVRRPLPATVVRRLRVADLVVLLQVAIAPVAVVLPTPAAVQAAPPLQAIAPVAADHLTPAGALVVLAARVRVVRATAARRQAVIGPAEAALPIRAAAVVREARHLLAIAPVAPPMAAVRVAAAHRPRPATGREAVAFSLGR